MRTHILLIIIIALCGLSVSALALERPPKWGLVTPAEWQLGPPTQLPTASAAVLFDIGRMEISVYPIKIKLERFVRIKIFDAKRADIAAQVLLPYYNGDKITNLEAHLICPDGKIVDVREFYTAISDQQRSILFTFPDLQDGAILEYQYRQTHNRIGSLDPWYFQGKLFVFRSLFTAAFCPGLACTYVWTNIPHEYEKPAESDYSADGSDFRGYTWDVRHVMPVHNEPLMAAQAAYLSSVLYSVDKYVTSNRETFFAKTWDEVGAMVEEWVAAFARDSHLVKNTADSLCAGLTDPNDKIRTLHAFVHDRIESRPETGGEVEVSGILERRYGSPSDKNTLLTLMLRSQGIKAAPLYIATSDLEVHFQETLPHLSQFNRLLCCYAKDTSWIALDAADAVTPYPYIPALDLIDKGLLVDGKNSRPIAVNSAPRESGLDIRSTIRLLPDGTARCSASVIIKGYELDRYLPLLSDSVSDFEVGSQFLDVPGKSFTIDHLARKYDKANDRICFDLTAEFPEYAAPDSSVVLSPFMIAAEPNPFVDTVRTFPVDFGYPRSVHQQITAVFPSNRRVVSAPGYLHEKIHGCNLDRLVQVADSSVNIDATLIIGDPVFYKNLYPYLRNIYNKMEAAQKDTIVAVVRKDLPKVRQGQAEKKP